MNDSRPPPRKATVGAAPEGPLEGAPGFETGAPGRIAMTRDSLEGARAFFEKRAPVGGPDVEGLQRVLRRSADARDREQFHAPKNLAAALSNATTRDSLEGARAFFEKRAPERAAGE